jgi:hypothetical protein
VNRFSFISTIFAILLACVISGVTLFGTSTAYAQTAAIDLSITSVPANPTPSQQVTITAQSYGTDISQADMVWTYNSKVIATGKGRTTVTVTAPASGVTGTIIATASGVGFDPTTASLVLRPASVDLVWEGADSYTPPFYKGLALPSISGIIRIAAIPSINAPKQLSYLWSQNDDALQAASGYGKSSILIKNDGLEPSEHIAVTEKNGGFTGNNDVYITPGNPVLAGYFNNNGFIDYANGSTNTLNTTGNGVIVHFEPYFFSSPNSLTKDLSFSYTDASGTALTPASNPNELPLSRPDTGASDFKTVINTIVFSLQNITKQFTVNFN